MGALHAQTTVSINPKTQRYVGGVSLLDRNKFFQLHDAAGDADAQQFYNLISISDGENTVTRRVIKK